LVLKWNADRIDAAWAVRESADLKAWTDPLGADGGGGVEGDK
jgi:hypothetical protein